MKLRGCSWRDALAALAWSALPVAIAAAGVPPLLQATVVVNGLLALIWLWSRVRDIPVFAQDETLASGARLGALFSVRMALFYAAACALGALPALLAGSFAPLLARAWAHRFACVGWLALGAAAATLAALLGTVPAGVPLFAALAAGVAWLLEDAAAGAPTLAHCGAERFVFYRLIGGAVTLPVASVVAGENWLRQSPPHAWELMLLQIALAATALLLRWGRRDHGRIDPRAVLFLPGALLLGLMLRVWPGWSDAAAALVVAAAAAASYQIQGTKRCVRAR